MQLNDALVYEIIEFNESSGLIVVFIPKTNQKFSIELQIDDNRYPEGEDLDRYIRGFLPTWVTERVEKINDGVSNVDYIKSLIPKKSSAEQQTNLLQAIRTQRNTLLYQSDWTDTLTAPERLGKERYDSWQQYRQLLRDITIQDLTNVEWPIKPEV
jgi:hypothetical protein